MPAIPLGLSNYERDDLPKVALRNMFYEKNPTNIEDQVALLSRPRLKAFAQAGDGPITGLYRKGGVLPSPYSGAILALSGDSLYRVTQTGQPGVGTATLIGAVEGGYRMSAEGNANAVVLARGTKAYTTDGASLAEISFPDGKFVYAIDTLNNYFLFCSELGRFYWSAIGGTTVSALDYATAESQPDTLLTLKVIDDELWLFGRLSIEVWQPTGDLDLPFQRIGGCIFGIGITARETAQKLNVGGVDTVCWLGTDRRVYRTNPNPERISTPDLEKRLQNIPITTAPGGTNPYGTTYSWAGHDFYVLHVPGEGSFAYDLTTEKWDDMTSYGRELFRSNVAAIGPNAQPLQGDAYSNQIWEFSDEVRLDGDDPVLFEFSGLLAITDKPTRCNNVSLDIGTGLTPDPLNDPPIEMSWSSDMGEVWRGFLQEPLGRQGQRALRVMWSRLGMLRRAYHIFRWRTTEPITVRGAKYNQSYR